jgi:hypothetical protein
MGLLRSFFRGHETTRSTRSTYQVRRGAPQRQASQIDYANPEEYQTQPVLTIRPWDYGHGQDRDVFGFGFQTDDRRIWPANNCKWALWEQLGVLVVHVVGCEYHLKDLSDRSFDPGRHICLVPEPDNPHDPKAISVRNLDHSLTAGYIKKGSTARLRNMLRGRDFRVMALSYCNDDSGNRDRLNIVIFRPDRLSDVDHIPPHQPL